MKHETRMSQKSFEKKMGFSSSTFMDAKFDLTAK